MSNDNETIRIVVNGVFYNYGVDGTDCLRNLLVLGMDKIMLMSDDGIKLWITESLNLIEETLQWKKDISLKKRITIYRSTLEKVIGRDNLIKFYTDIMLSCSGLSLLTGFKMVNVQNKGGKSKILNKIFVNPEKKSMRGV